MPEMLQLGLEGRAPVRRDPGYQLDVGRVISQTFSVTLANLPSFGLIALLIYSPALLIHLGAALAPLPPDGATVVSLLGTLLKELLKLILTGALTYGVINHLRGAPARIGETMQMGLGSLGRVLVVSLLVGIVTLLGFVLCVVPGLIVACMNWVAIPVAVIERPGIRAALDRSHDLTRGTRMAVFAVLLVIGMIVGVVGLVGTGLLTVASAAALGESRELSGRAYAVTQIIMTLLMIPFECLQATSAAVGYHDLRVHREGAAVDDLVRVFE
jgi:hypothetical protein